MKKIHSINKNILYCLILLLLTQYNTFAGNVRIIPTLDSSLDDNNSQVYCPTFLVTWNKIGKITGKPIELKSQPLLAKMLNKAKLPENVLPENSYVAIAGPANNATKQQLLKMLNKRFGKIKISLPLWHTFNQAVIFAYCYFQRSLSFPKRFLRSKNKPLKFTSSTGTHEVQFFGATKKTAGDYSSQVKILNYKDKDNFSLRLTSKITNEFIVLTKMSKPQTFMEGIKKIRQNFETKKSYFCIVTNNNKKIYYRNNLGEGDLLIIPIIDFSITRNFSELCNKNFINHGFTNLWINNALQNIKFKLDETGAYVKSEAGIDIFCSPKMFKKRRFIFNKPFLVTLWKKNALQPYLALWVANNDILLPFKKNN